jgi:cytochrome c oxidase subunit II
MMIADFPLFPEQASTVAGQVDALYLFLTVLTGTVSILIFLTVIFFALKYRRRPGNELADEQEPPKILEVIWIVIPAIVFLGIFVWGAWLYFHLARVPDDAIDVYATGRQWMWKFQHPTGQREINPLHVPVNRAVRITMSSEDVIHSLWFPNFRVKADVLPSRYRTMWFKATKPGRYHIFCAEYCGTLHSGMIGWVVVMEPAEYQKWLAGGTEGSLASQGEKLFQKLACNTCHMDSATGRGPVLAGAFGKQVQLADNSMVLFDENYTRESILNPTAKVVKGFQPIMPTFQGQVSEEDLIKLLSYIKSLADSGAPTPAVESPQSNMQSSGAPTTTAGTTAPAAPAAPTTPTSTQPASAQNQGR